MPNILDCSNERECLLFNGALDLDGILYVEIFHLFFFSLLQSSQQYNLQILRKHMLKTQTRRNMWKFVHFPSFLEMENILTIFQHYIQNGIQKVKKKISEMRTRSRYSHSLSWCTHALLLPFRFTYFTKKIFFLIYS